MKPSDKPAGGTHLFYLDEAGVLFSEAKQELHLLNATATLIWSLLEEGHDARSASDALQQSHGLEADHSDNLVAAAIGQWRDSQLLECSPVEQTSGRSTALDAPAPAEGPAWHQPLIVEERHYRLLDSSFCLRFSSVAQMRMVHPVLEHLQVHESSLDATVVDVAETIDGLIIYRDREFFSECAGLAELAPNIKSLVWSTAVNNHQFFLDIHAGVVGNGSVCILLPGPPGSGKSTLTALLAHAGYEFFSDEIALLSEGTFEVVPVPLAICIKKSGIAALADAFPQLRQLPLHLRGDGKHVAYLQPPPETRPSDRTSRPVAALVFPRYEPLMAPTLEPMAKTVALKRLLEECVAVRTPLDRDRVAALVQWISRMPCYSLVFGSGSEAIGKIHSILSPRRRT